MCQDLLTVGQVVLVLQTRKLTEREGDFPQITLAMGITRMRSEVIWCNVLFSFS